MLASYISAVLCSVIASFIDVLSLTVQCQPCSFITHIRKVSTDFGQNATVFLGMQD